MKSSVSQPKKQPQQLVQPLESRRLMSLTAGAEVMPPPVPTAPHTHFSRSFGIEQAPAGAVSPGFIGLSGFTVQNEFSATGQFPPPRPEFEIAFQDAVRALSTETALPVAAVPAEAASGVTLSEMYSSLGTSTVAHIDSAGSQSLASVVNDSVTDQMRSTVTTPSASPLTPAPVLTLQNAVEPEPIVTSDKALAKALVLFTAPGGVQMPLAIASTAETTAAPSWMCLRKLEEELTAVRAMADLVVSELGRDGAIALSHLESIVDPQSVMHAIGANWKSAALLTGAVATVAMLKNETDKKASPFSTRLIEEVAL